MSTAPERTIRRNNPRAIAWMIFAVGVLALMDAGLKLLSPHYSGLQVAALRGLGAWPIVVLWILAHRKVGTLFRVRWGIQVSRGVAAVFMLAAFAYALKTMPLSGVYVLFFVAPFIITAISVPLLGEKVEPRRWLVMGIGMIGVLIALRPTGEGVFTLAGLAVLFSATCYAVAAVGSRLASRTDSTESLMFWMTTILAIGATALAWPNWIPIRPEDTWIIVGVAFAGAVGQYALTEAFRWGEASAVAPFEYSALAWGIVLDLTIWHTLPDRWVFVGGAIIVASGIYLARREHAPPVDPEHP